MENPIRFSVTWTLGAIVMFPAASVGFLYSIKSFLSLLGFAVSGWFGHRFIVSLGIGFVLAMSMFGSLFIVSELLGSDDSETRRRAILVLAANVILGYFGAATLYTYVIYPRVPQTFGGGKPVHIILWIDHTAIPVTLASKMSTTFVQDGEKIRCESIYLVYMDTEIAVLSDRQAPPSTSVIVPRSTIGAISNAE